MQTLVERGCGLDVHQATVVACLLIVLKNGRVQKQVRTFGTTTRELMGLREWLLSESCTHVAMESTGVYWKPIYAILEGAFEIVVANAQHVKKVPGRKTDVKDAEWIADLQFLEQQMDQLDQELASLLHPHQDAVQRLAEMPGLGVDSAQQIIAEVGPTAETFPSEKCLSSWVGACPGDDESAGVNYSHRSPKGNRHMRRVLNQTANAAARTKGSIFDIVYRRSVPRLGHNQAIGAIAHRQCRLIWLILHQGVRYEERGPAVTKQSKQKRTARMIRQLRALGYRIDPPNPQPSQAHAQ